MAVKEGVRSGEVVVAVIRGKDGRSKVVRPSILGRIAAYIKRRMEK